MHDTARLHRHHRGPPVALESGRRTLALVVLCLCALTTAVDLTITNVALPFIGRELDAGTNGLQWVVDAYNIVLAGLLVLGGGLADRYGRRRVFLAGYALFGFACLAAAFSPTVEALIAARALMGVGAAGVVAPALAIIAGMYPPEERAGAIGLWAVFGAAGLAIGPVAGGFLLDELWWGSVFVVNVPLVALGVVLGSIVIPESSAPRGRLDLTGALLSVAGLGLLLFGIIEGPERGWLTAEVVAGLAGGVLVIAAFVRRELRTDSPLFDVRIAARPVVAAASSTLFVAYVTFSGMLFVLPQYLTDVAGESIVRVGVLLVPFALTFGLASMRAGAVVAAIGARVAITGGLAGTAAGMVVLGLAVDAPLGWTVAGTAVVALGLSLLIAPASTVMMNDLPESRAGDGSSFSMVSRFVGAAAGVAVVGSVFASAYSANLPTGAGPATPGTGMDAVARAAFSDAATVAYLVVAAVAALAAVVAWLALGRRSPAA